MTVGLLEENDGRGINKVPPQRAYLLPPERFRRYQGAEIGNAFGEHPSVQLSRYDAR